MVDFTQASIKTALCSTTVPWSLYFRRLCNHVVDTNNLGPLVHFFGLLVEGGDALQLPTDLHHSVNAAYKLACDYTASAMPFTHIIDAAPKTRFRNVANLLAIITAVAPRTLRLQNDALNVPEWKQLWAVTSMAAQAFAFHVVHRLAYLELDVPTAAKAPKHVAWARRLIALVNTLAVGRVYLDKHFTPQELRVVVVVRPEGGGQETVFDSTVERYRMVLPPVSIACWVGPVSPDPLDDMEMGI